MSIFRGFYNQFVRGNPFRKIELFSWKYSSSTCIFYSYLGLKLRKKNFSKFSLCTLYSIKRQTKLKKHRVINFYRLLVYYRQNDRMDLIRQSCERWIFTCRRSFFIEVLRFENLASEQGSLLQIIIRQVVFWVRIETNNCSKAPADFNLSTFHSTFVSFQKGFQ